MATNYSILVDVKLNTDSIKKQLKDTKLTVDMDTTGLKKGADDIDSVNTKMYDTSLTFQAANEIFSTSIDIISSMVGEVYKLDGALTEFKKVSDLSGSALDNYVLKLTDMGSQVARTGKPKCQAPNDGMVNQHYEPLEIQYSLRAYSTTMVA